jgi:hypothetical protein
MQRHPGGVEIVSEYVGRDATSAFAEVGHGRAAKGMLPVLRAGYIDGVGAPLVVTNGSPASGSAAYSNEDLRNGGSTYGDLGAALSAEAARGEARRRLAGGGALDPAPATEPAAVEAAASPAPADPAVT